MRTMCSFFPVSPPSHLEHPGACTLCFLCLLTSYSDLHSPQQKYKWKLSFLCACAVVSNTWILMCSRNPGPSFWLVSRDIRALDLCLFFVTAVNVTDSHKTWFSRCFCFSWQVGLNAHLSVLSLQVLFRLLNDWTFITVFRWSAYTLVIPLTSFYVFLSS